MPVEIREFNFVVAKRTHFARDIFFAKKEKKLEISYEGDTRALCIRNYFEIARLVFFSVFSWNAGNTFRENIYRRETDRENIKKLSEIRAAYMKNVVWRVWRSGFCPSFLYLLFDARSKPHAVSWSKAPTQRCTNNIGVSCNSGSRNVRTSVHQYYIRRICESRSRLRRLATGTALSSETSRINISDRLQSISGDSSKR